MNICSNITTQSPHNKRVHLLNYLLRYCCFCGIISRDLQFKRRGDQHASVRRCSSSLSYHSSAIKHPIFARKRNMQHSLDDKHTTINLKGIFRRWQTHNNQSERQIQTLNSFRWMSFFSICCELYQINTKFSGQMSLSSA